MATAQLINDILQQAEALFLQGEFAAASQLLSDGIAQAPSAKLWNDWAAVQVSLGQFQDAERGLARRFSLILARRQVRKIWCAAFRAWVHAEPRRFCNVSCRGKRANAPGDRGDVGAMRASGHQAELPFRGTRFRRWTLSPASPTVPDCQPKPGQRGALRRLVPAPYFASMFLRWAYAIACSWAEDSRMGPAALITPLRCSNANTNEASRRDRDKNIQGRHRGIRIYQGWWINFLHRTTEELGLNGGFTASIVSKAFPIHIRA